MGVEVFFVISGFVIPYSMTRGGYCFPRHVGPYLLKRFIRLEPPYLVAIAITFALWYASSKVPGFRGTPMQIDMQQLFYHLGYLAAFFDYPWVIPVFWSLAIEFQFYFVLAFLFPLLMSKSATMRLAALAIFMALGLLIPSKIGVFSYASLFAMGIVTLWKHEAMVSDVTYYVLLAVIAVAGAQFFPWSIMLVTFGTSLAIAHLDLPATPVFTRLGAISYSLYLMHVPIGGRVVNLGSRYAEGVVAECVVLAMALATSVAAAYVMFRYVERPAQRLSSRVRYLHFDTRPS